MTGILNKLGYQRPTVFTQKKSQPHDSDCYIIWKCPKLNCMNCISHEATKKTIIYLINVQYNITEWSSLKFIFCRITCDRIGYSKLGCFYCDGKGEAHKSCMKSNLSKSMIFHQNALVIFYVSTHAAFWYFGGSNLRSHRIGMWFFHLTIRY